MATTQAQSKTANTALLKNPRITEKAARATQYSIYLFDVAVNATKSEIAKAFETLYKHKPVKVNTLNVVRKSYFRRGKLGFGNSSKKAYVFLPKGTKIDII
jgi:large subunit ribosomal protein L23